MYIITNLCTWLRESLVIQFRSNYSIPTFLGSYLQGKFAHSVQITVFFHSQGRIFRDVTLPDMSPSERSAIYDAMNEVLARLHCLDWRKMGLQGYGKDSNYCGRQVSTMTTATPLVMQLFTVHSRLVQILGGIRLIKQINC